MLFDIIQHLKKSLQITETLLYVKLRKYENGKMSSIYCFDLGI